MQAWGGGTGEEGTRERDPPQTPTEVPQEQGLGSGVHLGAKSQTQVPAQFPGASPSLRLSKAAPASGHCPPQALPLTRLGAEETRPIQALTPTQGKTPEQADLTFQYFILVFVQLYFTTH